MRNYLCLVVFILPSFAVPAGPQAQKQLAKSPKILSAKTVYFDNLSGVEAVGTAALAQLKKWGRFQVVHDKQGADLILLLSADPYKGGYIIFASGQTGTMGKDGHIEQDRVPNYNRQAPARNAYLTVIDPRSGQNLWSESHIWGGLLTGADSAGARLVRNLQKQIGNDKSLGTNATCYEGSTGTFIGSHKSRTAVLISPDGRYRAYAESAAVASPNAGIEECQNTSKLFVAGPKSHTFHEVLVIKPLHERHGNSIELVDWSPTGHRLLLAEGAWEWGSDVFGSMTRIYDADSKTVSKDSLVDRVFLKTLGRDCIATLRPAGFSASGSVVVGTGPYFDVGDDSPDKHSCVTKEGLWLVDTEKSAASSLPNDYKVKHYGKESPEFDLDQREKN